VGEYRYSADGQGRISLPAKLREILAQEESSSLMAMKWFDGCIALMPAKTWDEFRPQLAHDIFKAEREARFFKRSAYRGMDFVVPDSQGRVLLNKDLRAHAGIESDVVIYGVGEWIECWDAKTFDSYMAGGERFYGSQEELAKRYLKPKEHRADGGTSGNEVK
jgi:MraZ protein